ncbi:MAG: hypothetical protein ACTTJF_00450 [Campylobacter sp.]
MKQNKIGLNLGKKHASAGLLIYKNYMAQTSPNLTAQKQKRKFANGS